MSERQRTLGAPGIRVRKGAILLYLVMVGLPVVMMLGLLRHGSRLEAPAAIHGRWLVAEGSTCGLAEGDAFDINQSGRFVVIRLQDRSPLVGHFDDGVLRVSGGSRQASAPGCGENSLNLALRLDSSGSSMAGSGGVEDCPACPPRPIRAIRAGGG